MSENDSGQADKIDMILENIQIYFPHPRDSFGRKLKDDIVWLCQRLRLAEKVAEAAERGSHSGSWGEIFEAIDAYRKDRT